MEETKVVKTDVKPGMIFEAINNCMKEIGAIGKNSKNQMQGFMFRGIDAVMNGIQPALIKNNIFVVPEILEQTREERQTSRGGNLIYSIIKVKYTFYAKDGSYVSATVIGEGMDSGDKATNKAMSIAFKYACFQVFCIPTEEMVDPDAECHEPSTKKKASNSNKSTTKSNETKSTTPTSSTDAANTPISQEMAAVLLNKMVEAKVDEKKLVKGLQSVQPGMKHAGEMTIVTFKKAMELLELQIAGNKKKEAIA